MRTPHCRWLVKKKERKKECAPEGPPVHCAALCYAFTVGHASFSATIKIF